MLLLLSRRAMPKLFSLLLRCRPLPSALPPPPPPPPPSLLLPPLSRSGAYVPLSTAQTMMLLSSEPLQCKHTKKREVGGVVGSVAADSRNDSLRSTRAKRCSMACPYKQQ